MGVGGCLYCNQDTGGWHEYDCPANEASIKAWRGTIQPYPKGWICPKCGAVWAPGVRECEHCKPLTFIQVNIAG